MTDAEQQTEPIQTEPKNMNVSGTIKIENKTKPTSLIKRTKEKLIDCGKDKRFEIYWDYTTNKSGTQQFTFTGKEMGQNFWSEKEKNKIKPPFEMSEPARILHVIGQAHEIILFSGEIEL